MSNDNQASIDSKLQSMPRVDPAEFRPITRQKAAHREDKSLRELRTTSDYFSRIKPKIYIKKISIEDNPDNSAFLEETRNPHIAIQIANTRSDGSVSVSRVPARIDTVFPASQTRGDERVLSVRVHLCVKQLLDDDNIAFEIMNELGILKFLRVKIVALTNPSTMETFKGTENIHLLETLERSGVYVIGGQAGIAVPYFDSNNLGGEMEITSDGEIVRSIEINRSFEFAEHPEHLTIFAVPYFDVFSEENKAELEGDFSVFSMDTNFRNIFVGEMCSEIIFENSELKKHAEVFTRSQNQLSTMGPVYTDQILEVRPGLYAVPKMTSRAATNSDGTGGHVHYYYVDKQGNGWTNTHTDVNGNQHVHIVRNFKLSSSGRQSELEDRFTPFENGHSHILGQAASNALYKKKLPINYIVDNRARNSLSNMKLELDRELEEQFSFLKKARQRANLIKPLNGSSQLAIYTTRNSQRSYFTEAYMSMDVESNCSFTFAFDHVRFAKDNTEFGNYISNSQKVVDYSPIHSIKVFRKRVNHYEEAGMHTFKGYNFEYGLKEEEVQICLATMTPSVNRTGSSVEGVSETAALSEFTPTNSQTSAARPARYFMCLDKSFSLTDAPEDKNLANASAILSSGMYVYGVEISIIDNTVDYFLEAQSELYQKIKMLENYIAVGKRKKNHSSTGAFTKAFATPTMTTMAQEIVNSTMMQLRKVFVNNISTESNISQQTFVNHANKMYQLIRPSTGSLYAAEKYLRELNQMMGYLKGITRIEDVGKYKAAKMSPGVAQTVASTGLPLAQKNKFIRKKHFFKDVFKKGHSDVAGVDYFPPRPANITGLVQITQQEFESAHRLRNQRTGSSFALLVPKFIRPGRYNPDIQGPREINEEMMHEIFYRVNNPQIKQDSFEVVSNQNILQEGSTTSMTEGPQIVSLLNTFGNSQIQDQLIQMQASGLLSSNNTAVNTSPRQAASGDELVNVTREFKESNLVQVEFFNGFSSSSGVFKPRWQVLTLRAYNARKSKRRPILCRLRKIAPGAFFGANGRFRVREDIMQDEKYWMRSFSEVFLITGPNVTNYNPTSTREQQALTPEALQASYDPEFTTSDPKIVPESQLSKLDQGSLGPRSPGSSAGGGSTSMGSGGTY